MYQHTESHLHACNALTLSELCGCGCASFAMPHKRCTDLHHIAQSEQKSSHGQGRHASTSSFRMSITRDQVLRSNTTSWFPLPPNRSYQGFTNPNQSYCYKLKVIRSCRHLPSRILWADLIEETRLTAASVASPHPELGLPDLASPTEARVSNHTPIGTGGRMLEPLKG